MFTRSQDSCYNSLDSSSYMLSVLFKNMAPEQPKEEGQLCVLTGVWAQLRNRLAHGSPGWGQGKLEVSENRVCFAEAFAAAAFLELLLKKGGSAGRQVIPVTPGRVLGHSRIQSQ